MGTFDSNRVVRLERRKVSYVSPRGKHEVQYCSVELILPYARPLGLVDEMTEAIVLFRFEVQSLISYGSPIPGEAQRYRVRGREF